MINFQFWVGTELKVVMRGGGFDGESIGKDFKVLEYSPTGYNGLAGYLCEEGTNERFGNWVSVRSFFNLEGEDYE
jgi:hypothetical protein